MEVYELTRLHYSAPRVGIQPDRLRQPLHVCDPNNELTAQLHGMQLQMNMM